VPGAVVLGLVALFYLALIGLALGAERVYPMGDEESLSTMEEESVHVMEKQADG
jgi:hypothetical protein